MGIIFFEKDSIVKERVQFTLEQSKDNIYLTLYGNSGKIFLDNNRLFGTGPQSYRYVCKKHYTKCSTHPHNFFLEILSDGGLLAILFLTLSLFSMMYFKLKKINTLFIKSLIISFTILFFFPLIPTGSFFSSYHSTITWFSLGFLYSLKKID